jgi:hypothetical protein
MTQTKAELLQTRHQGDIRLGDADSSHYVGFKAPATVGTSLVWTLPAADGTANYLLKTDGSGNLGWVADSSTDSTKMPLAGGTFTGDVTFTGASANIVFDKSDNALEFADNAKAIFGAGSDLQLHHNGTDSNILGSQGDLYIHNTGSNADDINIRAQDDILIQVQNGESAINCIGDGAVELYYDNAKKFETTSTGVNIASGNLQVGGTNILNSGLALYNLDSLKLADTKKAKFGSSDDLQIYHDGNHTYLYQDGTGELRTNTATFRVMDRNGGETQLLASENGAVELYHDNAKKLETYASGVAISGLAEFNARKYTGGTLETGTSNNWWKVGVISTFGGGNAIQIRVLGVTGYGQDDAIVGHSVINIRRDNGSTQGVRGHFYGIGTYGGYAGLVDVATKPTGTSNQFDVYVKPGGHYSNIATYVDISSGSGTWVGEGTDTGSASQPSSSTALQKDWAIKIAGGTRLAIDNDGSRFKNRISQDVSAVSATELNLTFSNYFTKTISGNTTFTFANPAASGQVTAFTLELTHSSGTVTWPSSVKWNADTAPTLTTGKTHLFMFVTDDGGTRYRGSALVDYVN